MTQWCSFFPVSYDLSGHSTFLLTWYDQAFDSSAFPTNWFESAHDSSSISDTWIDSTHDSSGFPGIGSESTHNSSEFPGIDSYRLLTQNNSRFFDSDQLMTQRKNIWFWFDSWFDSESYPCLLTSFLKRSAGVASASPPLPSPPRWLRWAPGEIGLYHEAGRDAWRLCFKRERAILDHFDSELTDEILSLNRRPSAITTRRQKAVRSWKPQRHQKVRPRRRLSR